MIPKQIHALARVKSLQLWVKVLMGNGVFILSSQSPWLFAMPWGRPLLSYNTSDITLSEVGCDLGAARSMFDDRCIKLLQSKYWMCLFIHVAVMVCHEPYLGLTAIRDVNIGAASECVCLWGGGYSLYEACYELCKWLDGWLGVDWCWLERL